MSFNRTEVCPGANANTNTINIKWTGNNDRLAVSSSINGIADEQTQHTHKNEQYSVSRIVLVREFTIDLTNVSPYHGITTLQTAILHTNIISLFLCFTEQQITASYTALEKLKTCTKVPRNLSWSSDVRRSDYSPVFAWWVSTLQNLLNIYIYFFYTCIHTFQIK